MTEVLCYALLFAAISSLLGGFMVGASLSALRDVLSEPASGRKVQRLVAWCVCLCCGFVVISLGTALLTYFTIVRLQP